MTGFLEDLARLRAQAGDPSYTNLKDHADRCGHDVSRAALAEVTRRSGARWATVEAFVEACVRYAARRGHPVPAGQDDLARWRIRYDAASRDEGPAGQPAPAGQLIGLIPPQAAHLLSRPVSAGPAGEPVRVLSGLGGVGKTQLAAAYARARLAAGDLVVWADASSRDAIVSRWADAAVQVAGAGPGEPERFLAWLATTARRWLVVLDDLTGPDDVAGLRPPTTAAGQVLITTRLRDTAVAGAAGVVDLGVFTATEGEAYLRAALPARLADDVAGVTADLGGLPVAMAQAAAYMTDLDITCSRYRRRFADRTRRLDDLFPAAGRVPGDCPRTVPVTWSLSIEAADRSRPAGLALPLLQMAAVLNPGGIPGAVLGTVAARNWLGHAGGPGGGEADRGGTEDGGTEDGSTGPGSSLREVGPDDVRDGLRRLHLFSLVTFDDGLVRVHELLQRAVRDRMSEDRLDAVAWAAADALLESWPLVDREQRSRAGAAALVRHAGERLWTPDGYHPVLSAAGNSLGAAGQVTAAAEHFRHLHAGAAARLGADHRYTLGALGNLALWEGEAGDPRGVRTARRVVDGRSRALGGRHPETLTARHTLALQFLRDGDIGLAEAELTSLLSDRTAILGAGHPDTLTTRHNLAACRGGTDPAAAVAELEPLVAESQRVLGADHPDTLSSRHELARWRGPAGDPARSVAELAELLTDRIRTLGPDHPDTLRTRLDLAGARAGNRPHDEVAAELTPLLDDVVRVLGLRHPLTAQAGIVLAMLHDDPDLAMTVPETLLGACVRVLGPGHPDSRSQGELVEALRDVRSGRDDQA